jgi:serine protease Do
MASSSPGSSESSEKVDLLGMELGSINDSVREQYNIGTDVSGVVVTDVDPNSEAAEKGIRPGDVVAEAQLEPVTNPDQMKERIAEIQATDKKSVLLLLKRGDNSRFIALKLNKES